MELIKTNNIQLVSLIPIFWSANSLFTNYHTKNENIFLQKMVKMKKQTPFFFKEKKHIKQVKLNDHQII